MNQTSLILTIHNKDFLVEQSLNAIKKFTQGTYELIIVLDGCADNSEFLVSNFLKENKNLKIKTINTPDVFETKANNVGLKLAESDYVIIIQDDQIVNEEGWNQRLIKPFTTYEDVFAVSANCSHNWVVNSRSKHIHLNKNLNDCWSDVLDHTDHAGAVWGLPRNTFAVRQCANRGPLAINHEDLIKLNYFDEIFEPLCMDDHDLCFRARKKLNKIVGCYVTDFISDFSWGGTHTSSGHKPWFYEANHKNTKIVWQRHLDIIPHKVIDNRKL